jgi:hypothetical protein
MSNSRIDCIDIDSFQSKEIYAKDYKHIYFIGSERQDRVHKCKEQREWKFSDLLEVGSKLPMQMAATNIAIISDDDQTKLGIKKHPLTANVWCERQHNGTFAIYQNYQYQKYRDEFLSHFTGIKHNPIYWEIEGEKSDTQNIIQVRTQLRDTYDASVLRVNPATTRRSNYWAYQFALIDKIHTSIRNGVESTLKADAIFLNIAEDLYSLKFDFYDAFEDTDKQYERLVSAVDRGTAEKSDEIKWLFPNLSQEEIDEKLARISAEKQINTESALESIIGGGGA